MNRSLSNLYNSYPFINPIWALLILIAVPWVIIMIGARAIFVSNNKAINVYACVGIFYKKYPGLITAGNLLLSFIVCINMVLFTARNLSLIATDVSYYLKVNLPAYDSVEAIGNSQSLNSFNTMVSTVYYTRTLDAVVQNETYLISSLADSSVPRKLANSGPAISVIYHTSNWDNLLTQSELTNICETERQIISNIKCLDIAGYKSAVRLVFDPQSCTFLTSFSESLYIFGLAENAAYVEDNIDASNPKSSILMSYFHLGSCQDDESFSSFYEALNDNSAGDISVCYIAGTYFNAEFQADIVNAVYVSIMALSLCSIFMVVALRGLLTCLITVYSIFVSVICAAAFLPLWGYGTFSAFNFVSIFILLGIGANAVLFFGSAWRHRVKPGQLANDRDILHIYSSVGWSVLFTIFAACITLFSKLISPVVVISQLGAFLGVAVLVFYVCFHSIIIPALEQLRHFILCGNYIDDSSQSTASYDLQPNHIESEEEFPSAPADTNGELIEADGALNSVENNYASVSNDNNIGNSQHISSGNTTLSYAIFSQEHSNIDTRSKLLLPAVVNTSCGIVAAVSVPVALLIALYFASQAYQLNNGLPQLFLPDSNLGQVMIVAQEYRPSIFTTTSNTDTITFVGANTLTPTSAPIPSARPSKSFSPSMSPTHNPTKSAQPTKTSSSMPSTTPSTSLTSFPTVLKPSLKTTSVTTLIPQSTITPVIVSPSATLSATAVPSSVVRPSSFSLTPSKSTKPTKTSSSMPSLKPSPSFSTLPTVQKPSSRTTIFPTIIPQSNRPIASPFTAIPIFISTSSLPTSSNISPLATNIPTSLTSAPSPTPFSSSVPVYSFTPSLLYSTSPTTSLASSSSGVHIDYSVTGCWGISWRKKSIDGDVSVSFDQPSFQHYLDASNNGGGFVEDITSLCSNVENDREYLHIHPTWNRSIDCIDSQYFSALATLHPSYPATVGNTLLQWAGSSVTAGTLLGTQSTSSSPYLTPLWVCANFSLRSYGVSSLQADPAYAATVSRKWQQTFANSGAHFAVSMSVPIVVGSADFAYPLLAQELKTSIELAVLISIAGIVLLLILFTVCDVGLVVLGSLAMVTTLAVTVCLHIYLFTAVLDLLDIVVLVALMSMIVDFPIHCLLYFSTMRFKRKETRNVLLTTTRDDRNNIQNSNLNYNINNPSSTLSSSSSSQRAYVSDSDMCIAPEYAHMTLETFPATPQDSALPINDNNSFNSNYNYHTASSNTTQSTKRNPLSRTLRYMRTALLGPVILSVLSGLPLFFLSDFSLLRKTGQYIIILSLVSFILTCGVLPYAFFISCETNFSGWIWWKCRTTNNIVENRTSSAVQRMAIIAAEFDRPLAEEDVEEKVDSS